MTGFVVADAGPIISYARAGELDILRKVLPQLYATPAVYRELTGAGADRPGAAEVAEGGWVIQHEAPDAARIEAVPLDEDSGEREAVALAIQLGLPVLLDERKAHKVARNLGLQFLTSLRVLATAKQRGIIAVTRPTLDALRTNRFRLSEQLYEEFLRSQGEL